MNKVCVSSVIFPSNLKYFDDFIVSLQKQDMDKFDIVLINDNVPDLKEILANYQGMNFIVHNKSGTPAENKLYSYNVLLKYNYTKVIFADTDDYFAPNRVSLNEKLLDKYKVVCNELTLIDQDKVIIKENYLSERINNEQVLNLDFILDKNILGFSNTAIRIDKNVTVSIDRDAVAADWLFFTTYLLLSPGEICYTDQTKTFYRQHSGNIVGIGSITSDKIKHAVKVKSLHYNALKDKGYLFKELGDKFSKLDHQLRDEKFSQAYVNHIFSLNIKNPLWWEEAKEYSYESKNNI
jgi:hypothetical protein